MLRVVEFNKFHKQWMTKEIKLDYDVLDEITFSKLHVLAMLCSFLIELRLRILFFLNG